MPDLKSGVDTSDNFFNWEELYDKLPPELRSPFFNPQYYQAYQAVEKQAVECFWAYQDDENFLFYPYLKKSINALGYELDKEYFDISGAYGYNGPTGIVMDTHFLERFNSDLATYLTKSKVVTEFVRYCPVTQNRSFHTYTKQIDILDNVYIDLSQGLDRVWHDSFEYRVRKTVRKGEAYGLRTRILRGTQISDSDLKCFYDIYNSTMQRNEADGFYYFDLVFFLNLKERMGDKVVLALTYLDDVAISAELVLSDDKLAFGFLGGTLGSHYKYKANTFQRWELLEYLSVSGVEKYSMGGGASRGDSIYSFKLSFAQGCVNPFFIGTKVHIPEVCKNVIAQWKTQYPSAAELYSGRLQGYRMQL